MRLTLAILSIALLSSAFIFDSESPSKEILASEGIDFFHGSWEEAKAKAAAENKPIFIDVYTTWCGPCKMMSRYTFTDEKVAEYYNKNFVCVKSDAERGEGVTLARKYKVRAYPTLLYTDKEGKILHKTEGALSANAFVQLGEKVMAKSAAK